MLKDSKSYGNDYIVIGHECKGSIDDDDIKNFFKKVKKQNVKRLADVSGRCYCFAGIRESNSNRHRCKYDFDIQWDS